MATNTSSSPATALTILVHTNRSSNPNRLYGAEPLHAGLVIIIPNVNRATQRQLFHGALDELARLGEPINRVLEVDIDGEDVTFNLYDPP